MTCPVLNFDKNFSTGYNPEMHDLALYRKYRPKNFKEVLGQDHIVKILESSVETNKVSHAYLFVGSRGTGKTSVARIFATSIGVSVNDLYEIDAASNRGIDDIKELRDGVRILPFDSKYKVYIIDEVHMLTTESFNALLKTLEEPPKHAIFILATTEINKLPKTIVSRCQHFDFRRLKLAEIIQRLKFIAEKEGIKIDPAGLELIALSSGGSFRDAEGLLDQAAAFSSRGKKETTISAEDLRELMGVVEVQKISQLMDRLGEKKAAQAIILLNAAFDQGADLPQLVVGLINHLHATLMYKIGGEDLHDPLADGLTDEEFRKLKERAGKFQEEELRKLINRLLEAQQQMKSSPIIQLPLELAIAEFCGI